MRLVVQDQQQHSMRRTRKYAWGDYYGTSPNEPIPSGGTTRINFGNRDYSELSIPTTKRLKNTPYYYNAEQSKDKDFFSSSDTLKDPDSRLNQESWNNIGQYAGLAGRALSASKQYNPDSSYVQDRQKTEGVVNGALEGVSAAFPVVGGFMKLGQGIGEQTTDKNGVYKNQSGQFIDQNINPTTGIQGLMDTFKDPTVGGLTSQFTAGLSDLFGTESASQTKAKQAVEANKQRDQARLIQQSQNLLANYPVYGVAKYGMKFPNGGRLPYPTTNSASYEQLSSDSVRYDGNTHAEGGIPLDVNNDGRAEIEVEDNEVIKDNMVYSDRLNPSSEFIGFSKARGIKLSDKDTYASAMETLGKKKGKYEENIKATGNAGTTAKLMVERLDKLGDSLFEDQQMKKKQFGNYSYAKGGKINENLNKYSGDIASGIGFGANQILINQLETDYAPDTVDRPQYTYSNRLPYLTNQIEGQFRAAGKNLYGASRQDNSALKANLYAKSLEAINSATDQELQRKNSFDANYQNAVSRVDMFNSQTTNAAKAYGLENRNQKTALTQGNIDNLIRSYQGNRAMKDAKQLDADKAYMAIAGDSTGAGARFYNQLPETLKKRYGWDFEAPAQSGPPPPLIKTTIGSYQAPISTSIPKTATTTPIIDDIATMKNYSVSEIEAFDDDIKKEANQYTSLDDFKNKFKGPVSNNTGLSNSARVKKIGAYLWYKQHKKK